MSPEVQYLRILLGGHLDRVRSDQRGVSAVEWVIITVLLIAIAGGVGIAVQSAVTKKSGEIKL
jgi:Flp pilus assembly protein TadG